MSSHVVSCHQVKPLLNALLDKEVDPALRAQMDLHLRSCPSCTSELQQLENLSNTLRTGMHSYKASSGLRDRVISSLRGAEYLNRDVRRHNKRVWGAIAAGVVLAALAALPFLINSRNQREMIAQDFVSAHQRALVGRTLDVVSTDRHTVKPWFNGKLPFSPPVVDLVTEGFPLKGGRLDYAAGHPVAALVYGRRLHSIDVFVWPAIGQPLPSHFAHEGFNEVTWTKSNFQFAAVSDLNGEELGQLAALLQAK